MWKGTCLQTLLYINFTGNASVPLIRRTCLEHVGAYNSWLKEEGAQGCEDWDLLLRIAQHYQFGVVRDYLVSYRAVSNSMSRDCMAMGRSYALTMGSAMRRHPKIPKEIWRWSKSYFAAYLTGTVYNANPRQALYWGRQALIADPVVLFVPWFSKLVIKSLLWVIADTIHMPVFGNRPVWTQLKRRIMNRFGLKEVKVRSIDEFTSRYGSTPHPWSSRRLYDRICIQRFQQTIEYGKRLAQR
jgi:hypothetical protein